MQFQILQLKFMKKQKKRAAAAAAANRLIEVRSRVKKKGKGTRIKRKIKWRRRRGHEKASTAEQNSVEPTRRGLLEFFRIAHRLGCIRREQQYCKVVSFSATYRREGMEGGDGWPADCCCYTMAADNTNIRVQIEKDV